MNIQQRFHRKRLFIALILFVITFGASSFQADNQEHIVFGQTGVGSITIVNATTPPGGTGFFYFGDLGSFLLDDGQSQQATNLAPGDYSVYQDVPAGWQLNISCV
ncbi:MAG: hypothetical protein GY803_25210, partial [Chloroflexi bacterium]|nr:hypothetical protein [Chloroflexota bacterium]